MRRAGAFLAVLMVAACGGGTDSPGGDQVSVNSQGVSASQIVVGSHSDLSGALALQGTTSINGIRMRFDEINETGGVHGRKIRFIVEDSAYQVPKAIQSVNKLINRDNVFAIIGAIGTPMNNAVMPRLFEKGVPNLFPFTGARSMAEPFKPLQFTMASTYYLDIRHATRYFVEQGLKTVCVIYQDTDFGQEIFDGAVDELEALGMTLAERSAHKPADSDFTTAVLRLRKAGCELVAMGTAHRDTILILEAAQKLGWTEPQWFGSEAAFLHAVAEVSSGATEGFIASSSIPVFYEGDPGNPPAVEAWMTRFGERFGERPEYLNFSGYVAGDLFIEALERAGPAPTRESFIAAMESIDDYVSLFGQTYRFGPNDHNGASGTVLSQVRDGRWVAFGEPISY